MARLRVLSVANEEAREADRGWRQHHPGRPRVFADEWKQAQKILRRLPLRGGPDPEDPTRHRLLLRGCQHYVYTRYEPPPLDEVVIVMVWSNLRGGSPPAR